MRELYQKLEDRSNVLENIIREKEESLKNVPEGILNVSATQGRVQYYYKDSAGSGKRHYIKACDGRLVQKLCQKEYDQKVLQTAIKELKQLEKYKKIYENSVCEDLYEKLNKYRKCMVTPIRIPDETYQKEWEDMEYTGKEFGEDVPEYYTNKEERVRSKSEILIANALERYGVPYRYECPLYLNGMGRIYPDFTVLDIKKRKELYWEHFGMMDDPQYAELAVRKIEVYEKNGFVPGDNLIFTYETRKSPINQRVIHVLIERNILHCEREQIGV